MTAPNYTPRNWYWRVAGSDTQVYSSASGDYVPVADAAYQAWLSAGNTPTNIPNEAELGEVLSRYSLRPVAAQVLDGYTETQAKKLTLEVVAKILFYLTNEVRALKGQQPVTAAQFKTFVKGLL